MKKNESKLDRIIRLILGIIFVGVGIALYFVLGSPLNLILLIILVVFGAIALFTAATGFCAIYSLLGISTLKEQN
jgi:hypothetical protein